MLDSFIELIPSKKGYGADHYIAYKRINQIWLCMDDATVRKAYLGKKFRINLAFFRNTTTTLPTAQGIGFCLIETDAQTLYAQKCGLIIKSMHIRINL